MGVKKENLFAVDVAGVIYQGRSDLIEGNYLCEVGSSTLRITWRSVCSSSITHCMWEQVAVDTKLRTLSEAIDGADVFLGLSVGNILTPDMLR